jgi:flagellar basal-body rod protein FlgC
MFGALHVSQTALNTYRTWLDAISDNVANMGTARRMDENAFQPRSVEQRAIPGDEKTGGGVRVTRVALGNPEGIVINDPTNPLADANGNVRMPDIDLGEQMTNLLMAQRAYQMNVSVIQRARDIYQQAMGIGR